MSLQRLRYIEFRHEPVPEPCHLVSSFLMRKNSTILRRRVDLYNIFTFLFRQVDLVDPWRAHNPECDVRMYDASSTPFE